VKAKIKTISNSQFLEFLFKKNFKIIPTNLISGFIRNTKLKKNIFKYSKEGNKVVLERV
jgi:predicted class III extradiol MEMO1 family dioxygenase